MIALAIVGTLLLAPGIARASCGDYVHVAGHKTPEIDRPAPRPPAPCHGPNCSRGPTQPPITPAPSPPLAGERWAVPLGQLILPEPDRATLSDGRPSAHGIRRSSPPSPPPRPVFA
jgi:hypothetical protein